MKPWWHGHNHSYRQWSNVDNGCHAHSSGWRGYGDILPHSFVSIVKPKWDFDTPICQESEAMGIYVIMAISICHEWSHDTVVSDTTISMTLSCYIFRDDCVVMMPRKVWRWGNGVIRSCKSKERQYNGQRKKGQTMIYKTLHIKLKIE